MPTLSDPRPSASAAFTTVTYGYLLRFVHFWGALALFVGLAVAPGFAQSRPLRIVAFGDSLSAGYLLPAKAAFPAALERALRAGGLDVEVGNAGVSGDTASAGLDRLDWAIGDDVDGVILELGANDMLRGLDPKVTEQALRTIVARLKQKGVRVLLVGMIAAPGIGRDYEERFNSMFPRIAKEMDVPLYPFFLAGVAGNPTLQLADGMHPNAIGVETIVKGILPVVRDFINLISNRS